jgi:site-specific recombinase XerD
MVESPEEFFDRQRSLAGALALYFDGFAAKLVEDGYSWLTTREQIRLVGGLGRWLAARQLRASDLDEATIDGFLRFRRRRGRVARSNGATLLALLEHLRQEAIVPAAVTPNIESTPIERVKRAFEQFLEQERGLSRAAQKNYLSEVDRFLSAKFAKGRFNPAALRAADVTGFVGAEAHRIGPARAKMLVTALRSFLRWLYSRGAIAADLSSVVPTVADWRLATLPKSIPTKDVELLLARCSRSSDIGRRNYAILLLLARLGLRACEIVAMELDDIDWHAGEIMIRGKGGRRSRLPLPQDAGAALSSYLCRGRANCATRRVFVRSRAPFRGFASSVAISCIVRRALAHAGLHPARTGAHVLRHSLAVTMLKRGASLAEIGEILRHRHPDTTALYAKVDLVVLRKLAPVWPGAAA